MQYTGVHVFLIRKSLFYLSLNFLNFSRNCAWDVLKFFLTFTEINRLEWYTLSLIILYTWIWIPSLTFWMQWQRNTDFWPIKTLNFGNWASRFSYDFLKILTIWASFSYKIFSYKKTCMLSSRVYKKCCLSNLTDKFIFIKISVAKWFAISLVCKAHLFFIKRFLYNSNWWLLIAKVLTVLSNWHAFEYSKENSYRPVV